MATTTREEAEEAQPQEPSIGFMHIFAMLLWLGGMHLNAIVFVTLICCLPNPWAFTALGLWSTNVIIPIFNDTWVANRVASFITKYAPAYFPIQVHVEDIQAFDPNRPYVLAAEPHSVLPIGIIVLTTHYGLLPFTKIKALATSAIFWTPVLRHVWSWLGVVAASKPLFRSLLKDGYSVIVIPGGVQECLHLQPGQETVFLRKRYGFIRCAMEAGSPLVPCFCFGQSEVYHYWKPSGFLYMQLSRAIGFTPLIFWGRCGSPVPFSRPMYFVVGKPIEVEKIPNPSSEEVLAVQAKFISAMEVLFEKHKSAAGCVNLTLIVN